MKLITEGLLLHEVTINDLKKIQELHLLSDTDRYNTLGIPESVEQTQSLVNIC